VDTPAGGYVTASNFVVRPTISSFSPGYGAANTNVTLTGANLYGTTAVYFNGSSASFTNISFSQVVARVPGPATTGLISITTTNGTHTNAVPFYIIPSITSFSPSNAPAGTWVKITGLNFTGAIDVGFGGFPANTFVVTNNTTIGALVPVGRCHRADYRHDSGRNSRKFGNVLWRAVDYDFAPVHGLPGTNVTIYGTNLLGATAIRFNGIVASSFSATNNGFARAVVPTNAQAGPISVTTRAAPRPVPPALYWT